MIALYTLYAVFSAIVGAAIGSFWNVCIARWPEDRSVVRPRSACPSCGTPIAATDNIPVLSWMLLRGACRSCGWKIPVTYPLVELLGACVGFLVFRRVVPGPEWLDAPHLLAWVIYFGFASALIIGIFVDVRHRIIPDEVTIFAVPVGILGCVALDLAGYEGWLAVGWRSSVLGALIGGGFFAAIAFSVLMAFRREGLGWGDVKLLAMIGAFLGVHPALFFILLTSSVTGSIIGIAAMIYAQRRVYMPMAPTLAGWALIYLLYGDVLMERFFPGLAQWTELLAL